MNTTMSYQRSQLTIPRSSLKDTKMCSKTLEIYDKILKSKGNGKILGSYTSITRPKSLGSTGIQFHSSESYDEFAEESPNFSIPQGNDVESYGGSHYPKVQTDYQQYAKPSYSKNIKRSSLPYKKTTEDSFNAAQMKLKSEIEHPHPQFEASQSQSPSPSLQRPVPATRIPSLPSFHKKPPIRPREKYVSGKYSPTALDMVLGALKAGGSHYQRGMHYDDIMDLIKSVYNIPQTHHFNSSLKNALAQLVAKGTIAKSFGSRPEDALYKLRINKIEPEISMSVCGKAVPEARSRWPTGLNLSVTGTNSFHSRPPAATSVSLPNLLPSYGPGNSSKYIPKQSYSRNPQSTQLPPIEHVPYAGANRDPMITQSFATRAGASAMRLKPDIERRPNTPDSVAQSSTEYEINSTIETYLGSGTGMTRGMYQDDFDEEYDFNAKFELDNLCKVFPRNIKSSGFPVRKETVAEALSTSNIIPKEFQSLGFGTGEENIAEDINIEEQINTCFASTGTGDEYVNEEYEDMESYEEKFY